MTQSNQGKKGNSFMYKVLDNLKKVSSFFKKNDRKIVTIFLVSISFQLLFGLLLNYNWSNSISVSNTYKIDQNKVIYTNTTNFNVSELFNQPPKLELLINSKLTAYGLNYTKGEDTPDFYLNFTITKRNNPNTIIANFSCGELNCKLKMNTIEPGEYDLIMHFQVVNPQQTYSFEITEEVAESYLTFYILNFEFELSYLLFLGIIWTFYLGFRLFTSLHIFIRDSTSKLLFIILICPMFYLFLKDFIISVLTNIYGHREALHWYGITTIFAFVFGILLLLIYFLLKIYYWISGKDSENLIRDFFSIDPKKYEKYNKLFDFLEKLPAIDYPLTEKQLNEDGVSYVTQIETIWKFKNQGTKEEKLIFKYLKSYGEWIDKLKIFQFRKHDKFLYSFDYSPLLKGLTFAVLINATIPLGDFLSLLFNSFI